MLLDEGGGLGVHVRVDELVQRLRDDLLDLLHRPALAEGGDVVADPRDLLVVGPAELEHQLGIRRLDDLTPGNQAIPIERPPER